MILRLEVNEIGHVIGSGALRLARITQTRTSRTNGFVFSRKTVTVKRFDLEMFKQERGAIVSLPLPIVERRQRHIKTKLLPRVCGSAIRSLKRQRRRLHFARQTRLDKRAERCRKQQLTRRIRLERR